jgi:hypothetical protein
MPRKAKTPPPVAADPIPEPVAPRKKPNRFWLYLPFILLVLLAGAYSAFWVASSRQLAAAVDARAATLRQSGYVVELSDRRSSGFPFRLKLQFTEARVAAPSGWAVTIPGFEAEAYLHNLRHWVVVAPQGLTFTRPDGGPVKVLGAGLRASVVQTNTGPWRIVAQAQKATFAPSPGARPFSLASADLVEFYLRPSDVAGQGMFLLRVENGKAQAGSLAGRIAGDGVVGAAIEGRISKTADFAGATWGDALRAWSAAGGVLEAVQGTMAAGTFSAKASNGTLGVGSEGRLVGAIPLELRQPDRALTALAETATVDETAAGSAAAVAAARAQGEATTVNLVFQAGVMTFGPVRLGPAPKVG